MKRPPFGRYFGPSAFACASASASASPSGETSSMIRAEFKSFPDKGPLSPLRHGFRRLPNEGLINVLKMTWRKWLISTFAGDALCRDRDLPYTSCFSDFACPDGFLTENALRIDWGKPRMMSGSGGEGGGLSSFTKDILFKNSFKLLEYMHFLSCHTLD